MEKINKILKEIGIFLKKIGEKIKGQALKGKEMFLKMVSRIKKSPRLVKTILAYSLALIMMFSFMAWQRSRISLNIQANDPPMESEQENKMVPNFMEEPEGDAEGEGDDGEGEEDIETVFNIKDEILWPIDGFREIEGRFKEKFDFGSGDEYFLDGILISAPKGSKVRAALPGEVIDVNHSDLYGNVVKVKYIDPNDDIWECIYYNLERIEVEEGQNIDQGDSLGYVSSNLLASKFSEEHIVFELKKNSKEIDPEPYF